MGALSRGATASRASTASRAALCALLAGRCAAFTYSARPPRSVTCRFVLERAPDAAGAPPRRKVVRKSTQTTWDERYRELSTYRSTWGTADAPLGDSLGRWCRTQRQQHAEGKLSDERVAKLDALEFSWKNPTELSTDELEAIWDTNVEGLRAYVLEHGNGQVPKKYKLNPRLGGWVAAVRRRGPDALPLERRSDLENAGFEWISTRKCGSAFMKNFRALRDLPKGEAPSSELKAWAAAQKKLAAKGGLSAERRDYLASVMDL
ncbi:unnamed protein product [Pelagomonas calceolata]|uniref:Helicase-associated domain-containing protein n=1 Tax=Pelagomonas calceolata TaxID=35677 RepID=A0A8J2SZG8_9STRA|nr:unnamed protein product [Pelagomonas calceolata]|mmetsp:Transcript_19007/g.54312  ORF Transcript_19007/g.54312 Transcript_19007/m.54312 type:complete len:263 (-) Transcript_19007:29-817(-)